MKKSSETIRKVQRMIIKFKSDVTKETIPDMEIRPAGSKVQVPNNVAWDAKLQSTKGPDNNESQSIISCLEHTGTEMMSTSMIIYLHTR